VTLTSRPTFATPGSVPAAFAAALNAGDLELAAACFIREACLIAPGSTAVHGREAICGLLAQMIAAEARIEIDQSAVVRAGDVAHARQRWTLSSAATAGGRYNQTLSPTLVLRRLDAGWKLAIAMPWG
jgi:uncharacterized protein (TIGR02246 family)